MDKLRRRTDRQREKIKNRQIRGSKGISVKELKREKIFKSYLERRRENWPIQRDKDRHMQRQGKSGVDNLMTSFVFHQIYPPPQLYSLPFYPQTPPNQICSLFHFLSLLIIHLHFRKPFLKVPITLNLLLYLSQRTLVCGNNCCDGTIHK